MQYSIFQNKMLFIVGVVMQ